MSEPLPEQVQVCCNKCGTPVYVPADCARAFGAVTCDACYYTQWEKDTPALEAMTPPPEDTLPKTPAEATPPAQPTHRLAEYDNY